MFFGEVEEVHHVLFRCPAYADKREAMAARVCAEAPVGVIVAMKRVQRQRSVSAEKAVLEWMMTGGGEAVGMAMIDVVMRERARLLGG